MFNANNVDPDQAPRSDLGLLLLPMSLLWDARLKWVKYMFKIVTTILLTLYCIG